MLELYFQAKFLNNEIIVLDHLFNILFLITSFLTDSYTVFTLKMESVSKNTIFGLKMMVKSGLEKNLFEIPASMRKTTFSYFIKVPKITNSVINLSSCMEVFQNNFF